jgi:hypothetical protein
MPDTDRDGSRVQGSGFWVLVQGSGFKVRVQGSGFAARGPVNVEPSNSNLEPGTLNQNPEP